MTVAPVFNRTNANNAKGLYTVNLRVNVNGKVGYFKIKNFPKLEKKHWDKAKNRVGPSHPFDVQLNAILERECTKINKFHVDELTAGRHVTFRDVQHFYDNPEARQSLNAFIHRHIRVYIKKNERKHRTWQSYMTMSGKLDEFNPEIRFYEVNGALIEQFNDWMKQMGNSGATRQKYMTRLQRMLKEADKAHLLKHDKLWFDRLNTIEKPDRIALTVDEIKKIRDLDLAGQPTLEQARDEFYFLCCTGLYYSDLRRLTADNLVTTEYGLVLRGDRSKNGHEFIVPLYKFPHAIAIMERYRHTTKDEFIFPDTFVDQYFNKQLKQVAALAGIEKTLTNKIGRHSFADLMIGMGYEQQFVSRMMGHEKTATTESYFRMNANHLAKTAFGREQIDL